MSFLPVGSHLLPEDFQTFISNWNKAIFTMYGSHVGDARKQFQREYPETWAEYRSTFAAFQSKYAAEVEALKAYQEEHPSEAESESDSDSEALSKEFAEMKMDAESEEENQPLAQAEPQPLAQEEHQIDEEPQPKRPRSKYINHRNWPSPRAKVFAKHILLRSWPPELVRGRLTHDEALQFLTTRLPRIEGRQASLEDLLAITPKQAMRIFFGSGMDPLPLRRYSRMRE